MYAQTKASVWMFTAALFTITKTRKQLAYPSVGKANINALWKHGKMYEDYIFLEKEVHLKKLSIE